MNRIILLIVAIVFFGFKDPNNCGGIYRWDNKILIDPAGQIVFKQKAKSATIDSLVKITKPANTDLGKNRALPEKQKVTIIGWVTDVGEETDHDFHLVVKNNAKSLSLIAEIPDPSCDKLSHFPALQDAYEKARTFVKEHIQEPTSQILPVDHPVKVKITGVVFFDKGAHGNGHASNSIEIHPVLKIELAN